MPTTDTNSADTSSAKPDVRTPNADGLDGQKIDELNNDARTAPKAPKMSGGSEPDANPLDAPPDLRDAGEPEEPLGTDEPRTGR